MPSSHAVRSGLDVVLADPERLERLRGARVALLVNPTSTTASLTHAIDALLEAGVDIAVLFGPEHGIRAEAQDMEAVSASVDPVTGLPVRSLYGHTLESVRPRADDLDGLDIVVCDIQDVGARYYTYAYTIGLMMEACGQAGVEVWVLDRPNPLGGKTVRGNVVALDCRSFVGMQPLAVQHGMTMGELARFFARYGGWDCELEIVTMQGWQRAMWFEATGLPWVMPSPNMPTLDTASVYPGQCILEGTNLSEGRGTTRPFELFGAPWVDAQALAARMDAFGIEGVYWRALSFKPMFQKHGGHICAGLQLHVLDRARFDSVRATIALIGACLELFEDFGWREQAYEFVDDIPAVDLLLGERWMRQELEAGADPLEVASRAEQSEARREFDARRADCLLYHDDA